MEISELTLKLIILLVPGALSSVIYERLAIHRKWTPFQFIANSILFGVVSYLIAQIFFDLICRGEDLRALWANLSSKEIPFSAVLKSTACSIFLALLCVWFDYRKLLNKFAKRFGMTNKFGDENLYTFFLNASNVEEVYIRDIDNNITYHGMIDSFSETETFTEMSLFDVKVYEYKTSNLMYAVDKLYLSKLRGSLIIEVPLKS